MVMKKKWLIRDPAPNEFKQNFPGLPDLVTQLLYNRGLQTASDIERFLNPAYERLHSPFLFKEMPSAVERIWQAIESGEKILVHGDYDADGVTAAAVLVKTLKMLNANVEVFIPHREDDGYGLNIKNLNNFVVQGVKLLITVDCGISNADAVEALKVAGVEVIITDHHEPPETLPKALAIINPKVAGSGYPFPLLSGAGIAFKVAQALLRDEVFASREKNALLEKKISFWGGEEGFLKWLLDIVAVGTVADVVPLIDENRILVKWGLVVLNKTRNIGLKKLIEAAGIKRLDAQAIAFQIAPRLNAAGRMNHASAAFELLMTEDESDAERLALELNKNNQARQRAIDLALIEAKKQIVEINHEPEKALFVYNENWPAGIVGLIAGRLCDEYYKPVFAMTISNGNLIGSGRSISEFNIVQGLKAAETVLIKFGGHRQACGFTLKQVDLIENFKTIVRQKIDADLAELELTPVLEIDGAVSLTDFTFEIIEQILKLAPFGEGNRKPLFLVQNLQIVAFDVLGEQGKHLRLLVKNSEPRLFKMMLFNEAEQWLEKIRNGDMIDAVCEVGINEWNGNREAEFKVKDMKLKV
jgi:single-stranded-DNA-specific exonuclease